MAEGVEESHRANVLYSLYMNRDYMDAMVNADPMFMFQFMRLNDLNNFKRMVKNANASSIPILLDGLLMLEMTAEEKVDLLMDMILNLNIDNEKKNILEQHLIEKVIYTRTMDDHQKAKGKTIADLLKSLIIH